MAYKRVTLIKVRTEYKIKLARNIGRLMVIRRAKRIAHTNRLYGEYALIVQVRMRRYRVCVAVSVCDTNLNPRDPVCDPYS